MTDGRHHGSSHAGVPEGDSTIEVTVRLFLRPHGPEPTFPPAGGPFTGETIEWSYPEPLHGRALSHTTVIRHAISALLDDLSGDTHIDAQ